MDMTKDPAGYGIGIPWHFIAGLIVLVFVVIVIVKFVKLKKNREQ